MEAYASVALSGLGYAYSQKNDPYSSSKSNKVEKGDMPSMNNMYNSTHWNDVRKEAFDASTMMYNKAKKPLESGVVSRPAYSESFTSQKPRETAETVTSLTGQEVPIENFTHNNMKPYIRGNNGSTQSVDPFATSAYLEKSTGISQFHRKKEVVDCFFEPTTNMGNVCGMKDNGEYNKQYIEKPRARNNDFPIPQIQVGPGIDQGYGSLPSGGFQQAITESILRPKTIDELRPLSKPKTTYELPVQGPKKQQIQNRGLVTEIAKNRPENFHVQTPDQWIKTTGAQTKQSEIPQFIVKPTARVDSHIPYMGAGKADAMPGMGVAYDYGKDSIIVYSNARDDTQHRSILTNLSSIVKTITAPFLDILKPSQKAYTLDASRLYGNMSAQIPEKPTTYDPVNHIMKTTVKETTIHDTSIMNPRGNDKGWVNSDDDARKTVKETTVQENDMMNPRGNDKGWVNSDDDARKTIRETTEIRKSELGNVVPLIYKTVVINPELVAKRTVKETTSESHRDNGNATGQVRGGYSHVEVQVFDTQKQYMSDNPHTGIGGATHKSRGGYTEANVDVLDTQKQYTSDTPHTGIGGGGDQYRMRTVDAEYNAQIDGTREMLSIKAGYTPNAEGISQNVGSDGIDLEVKRIQSDEANRRVEGNVNRIYQQGGTEVAPCSITKDPQKSSMVHQSNNRLDTQLLSVLKENPYNLSINPI